MAEEVKKDEKELEKKTAESNFEEEDSGASQVKKVNLFDQLFANNNKLLTVNGSEFAISNETRRLLALFSDGTYLVSKDNRFDGAVYNFEANVKRRKIPIKAPRYVTLNEIAAIYAYAERGAGTVDVSAEEAEDMQMQIDFINIIQRASQKKVSDVHVVVRRRYCFVKTALWLNRTNMAANGEKHLSVRFLRQRIFRTPTTRKMNFKAHKNLVRHLCAVLKAN